MNHSTKVWPLMLTFALLGLNMYSPVGTAPVSQPGKAQSPSPCG